MAKKKPPPPTTPRVGPPKVEPPKITPGKETARSIGIDTAFIDGLAAGLVDEADLPPPPKPTPKPVELPKPTELAKPSELATPSEPPMPSAASSAASKPSATLPLPKAAAPRRPPQPKGLSERSEPLFRVAETPSQADDDPLAALLDLPAEPRAASGAGSFSPPKRGDDLLARLAAQDDDDGSVTALPPPKPSDSTRARLPPPKSAAPEVEKGASESSGRTLARGASESSGSRGRSEISGNAPLPKGADAPEFDVAPTVEAKPAEAKTPAREGPPKPGAKKASEPPAAAPPPKPKPTKEAPKPARAEPVLPVPAAATSANGLERVHPGVWLLLAAVVFGLFVPPLAGGGDEPAATKGDAARRAAPVAASDANDEPAERVAAAADADAEAELDAIDQEEEEEGAAAPADPEEVVEIEEDVIENGGEPSTGHWNGKRKPEGGEQLGAPKTASQLLTEAKAAYSQGRNRDAYDLAGKSHRERASEDALIVKAKAACRMGNEGAASRAFEALPMGEARREVRPVCRDKGIHLGI